MSLTTFSGLTEVDVEIIQDGLPEFFIIVLLNSFQNNAAVLTHGYNGHQNLLWVSL